MNRIAKRSFITGLLALLLIAGMAFFVTEYISESSRWVMFSGSPHVYTGGNIGCGVATDKNGILLLDLNQGRQYSESTVLRKSTVHWLGDRNGSVSAPALPKYAAQLAGYDLLSGVYSYGGSSGVAKLTLSANVQAVALEAMGDYKGTVAVYNYKTGQLLCAVTTPTYDPDNIPDIENDTTGAYEGVYVNRFTQSAYIPGSIYKIVTLAAALETIPDIQNRTFTCTGSYEIGADKITCEGAHWDQSLKDAFCNSCNCAFAQIALELGPEVLERYVEQFGVNKSISFDGIATETGNFQAVGEETVNVAWSAIGQYKDQVNPCAFLTFVGAVAGEGRGVTPYLVEDIHVGSSRTYSARTQTRERIMSADTARIIGSYMENNVAVKYGDYNFPGLTVCAKTGTGEVGEEKKPNAMFAGFTADEDCPLAFIVCVEDGGYGSTVCIPIASKVLSACAEEIRK